MKLALAFVCFFLLMAHAFAGPLAWGTCQTACNLGAVKCYSASGLIFGVSGPITGGIAAFTCSAIQGTCMAACTPLLVAPTP